MMKSFGFLAFITMILFRGCADPEGILEIKGKVLDADTKVTIPRRVIEVQALVNSDDKYIPVSAGQFVTDSAGCFIFNLKKVRNSHLFNFSLVGDSAYAFSANRLGLTELLRDGKFLTFYLNKLTDFTITIDRKSKTSSPDTLIVWWESNGIDGKIIYPYIIENYDIAQGLGFIWIGGNIKSSIKTKAYADKKTIVYWKLYRNGERKEITDTIFCLRDVPNYVNFKY
jgi:hypothetical protein